MSKKTSPDHPCPDCEGTGKMVCGRCQKAHVECRTCRGSGECPGERRTDYEIVPTPVPVRYAYYGDLVPAPVPFWQQPNTTWTIEPKPDTTTPLPWYGHTSITIT